MKNKPVLIGIVLFLLWQPGLPRAAAADYHQAQAVRALRLYLTNAGGPTDPHSHLMNVVIRFYEDRGFQPAWMSPEGLTLQGTAMLDGLKSSSVPNTPELKAFVHHLELVLRDGRQMMAISTAFPLDALLEVETGITASALYYIIRGGTDNLFADGEGAGPVGSLHQPAATGSSGTLETSAWQALINAATPRQKPFQALKRNLERFQTIRLLGGWPTIPDGRRLRPGCKDPRVPLLRRRLIISGDMGLESLGLDQGYDDALAEGVRRFQQRHGLNIDGMVGSRTLAALNTSVEERITQIKLNMLRWRRLPNRMGPRYLLANIPGFKLDVVNNHQVVRSMRTIVGKPGRQTPEMSATMTYMEINPYWNIPRRIASTDILPKIHADPRFLLRNHIQVFDSWREYAPPLDPLTIDWKRCSKDYFPFRLRQKPSASNALGRIKFIFPNRFSVYIHDTPVRSLFGKTNRSFSSGCVRVEEPMALADCLLAAQGWDRDRIEAKVKRRERTVVVLKHPVPVYLVYMTAWADDDDTVHFYHDLYGNDQKMLDAVNRSDNPLGIQPADLMAIDRILERTNASAASTLQQDSKAANDS